MSKAFTKEDDEIPERAGRMRSGKGLPPGATNYMTAEGARRLREELAKAKKARAAEIQQMLDSATVVPEREEAPGEALFGTTVTLRGAEGQRVSYRIVGADETTLAPGWVSWVSPVGKALLGVRVGQRVRLADLGNVEVLEIR